ncbi:MAG: MmgE/PrpD family protein [Rhodospirillales bacterium]
MTGLSERIADFVTSTNLEDIPELARTRGARAITDTIGVMAGGAAGELVKPLRAYLETLGATGNVPVLGTEMRTDAEHAALLNAAFGHALDFDDGYPYYPVHASTIVIGALIASLGNKSISGKKFLESYVLGMEVVTCIGRGLGMGHYIKRGFHATGTLSVFGAVAAIAKLQGRDKDTLRRTLGIAASMSSGIQRNFGTMMKAMHSGMAARNGVTASLLAASGVTGHMDVMEGKDNFFQAYGDENSSAEKAGDLLGNPFAFVAHGVGMKKFPCCNACARPIDGLLELRKAHNLTPDTVASIHCVLPPGGTNPLHYVKPKNANESAFSLEYCMAVALVDGAVGLDHFSETAIERADLMAALEKVTKEEHERCIAEDPLAETRGPGPRGFVEVHVATTDGQNHDVRVDVAPGYPGRELTSPEMWAKFSDCTAYAGIAETKARGVFDRLEDLEAVTDVRPLIEDLA